MPPRIAPPRLCWDALRHNALRAFGHPRGRSVPGPRRSSPLAGPARARRGPRGVTRCHRARGAILRAGRGVTRRDARVQNRTATVSPRPLAGPLRGVPIRPDLSPSRARASGPCASRVRAAAQGFGARDRTETDRARRPVLAPPGPRCIWGDFGTCATSPDAPQRLGRTARSVRAGFLRRRQRARPSRPRASTPCASGPWRGRKVPRRGGCSMVRTAPPRASVLTRVHRRDGLCTPRVC